MTETKTQKKLRALVVDDEEMLSELLTSALRFDGWEVEYALNGKDAIDKATALDPHIVILDMMLPDMTGIEVLRRLRQKNPLLPVMFLTAKDSVEERVKGLKAGGDDYVSKPFSLEEVIARLRSLLRRVDRTYNESGALRVGSIVMDEEKHEVRQDGEEVKLTATEFELLRFFLNNPQRVLTKANILDRVWHYDFGGEANIVELYVSYLRKKLKSDASPSIQTIRGVGYILK